MTDEPLQVNIRILDKDYRIACAAEEQQDLRDSARMLDTRMRAIRQTGRVIGTDRIAVMAALNIAHELLQLQRQQPATEDETIRRLRLIQSRVAQALADQTPVSGTVGTGVPLAESRPAPPDTIDAPAAPPDPTESEPLDASDKRV